MLSICDCLTLAWQGLDPVPTTTQVIYMNIQGSSLAPHAISFLVMQIIGTLEELRIGNGWRNQDNRMMSGRPPKRPRKTHVVTSTL